MIEDVKIKISDEQAQLFAAFMKSHLDKEWIKSNKEMDKIAADLHREAVSEKLYPLNTDPVNKLKYLSEKIKDIEKMRDVFLAITNGRSEKEVNLEIQNNYQYWARNFKLYKRLTKEKYIENTQKDHPLQKG